MTSGVYLIEFPSGAQYIGKSVNIDERWKQHLSKMKKGTAAKPMQAEWNTYGNFNASVLLECHEDHIDVVEAHYINRYGPTLNSAIPEDPYAGMSYEFVDELFSNYCYSTVDMVKHGAKLQKEVEQLKSNIASLEEDNDMLMEKRTDEELKFDVECKVLGLEQQLKQKSAQIEQLKLNIDFLSRKITYYELPWWKRWFR